MNTGSAERTDAVFKALASRPRRQILEILATGGGAEDGRCCDADEICACIFAEKLELGAPTVSHHMKVLLDAGLVSASKRGLWVYYRLVPGALESVAEEFAALTGAGGREGACVCDPETATPAR